MPAFRVTSSIAVSAILGGLVLPQIAEAIYRRPDRSDERYQELGQQFPAVCDIVDDGTGTLIAPTWVLTHNHFLPEDVPEPGDKVRFGDRSFTIKKVIRYPGGGTASQVDLALLELTSPVTGIVPIPLYVWSDELQQECKLVGYGLPGEIMRGRAPRRSSETYVSVRRAGTNLISRVSDKELYTTIDLSEEATDLEAAGSAGDSGGPLLIEIDGQVYLAGVITGWVIGDERDMLGRRNSEDQFTRVSTFAPWIEKTTGHDFGARTWQKWGLRIGSILLLLTVISYIKRRRKLANLLGSDQKQTQ